MSLAVNDDLLESVAGTNGARDDDALQVELGEGPSYTSLPPRAGPVLVPDVRQDATLPTFGDAVEIHQAAGVASVQLEIDVGTALTVAVLRARAFANDQSLPVRSCERHRGSTCVDERMTSL